MNIDPIHQALAERIAVATLPTIKRTGSAQEQQASANLWASSAWNLATLFLLATPQPPAESQELSQADLQELSRKKKARKN